MRSGVLTMDRLAASRLAEAMTKTWDVVTIATATGCAATGGVFFAFSAFVMAGLKRLPDAQGITAMQSINVTAVRPPLMIALFGSAALCVALVVRTVTHWGGRESALLLAAALLFLVGAVVLTAAYNVPLNDKLAKIYDTSPDSVRQWHDYLRNWTLANHVRAAASLGAMVLLVLSLTSRRPG